MGELEQRYAQTVADRPERRALPRTRTVCLVVKVTRTQDAGLFRARNISDAGMMLATHVPFVTGERVTIDLSDNVTIRGGVEWCRDGLCGIRFDHRIDSAAFLVLLAEEKRMSRRHAQRLAVQRLATSYSECGVRPVTITDVSPRGVGLLHNGALARGARVKLVLESGLRREGAVCWSHGRHAGLLLVEPFGAAVLESALAL